MKAGQIHTILLAIVAGITLRFSTVMSRHVLTVNKSFSVWNVHKITSSIITKKCK
jgi:hypothetical protein